MLKLTRSKVNFPDMLPECLPFTRKGKTSLIYDELEDGSLQVYTIEEVKLEWWQHLGLIDHYDLVCQTTFKGYYHGIEESWNFPLYTCVVPKLQEPTGRHASRLEYINDLLDIAYDVFKNNTRGLTDNNPWFSIVSQAGFTPEVDKVIRFIGGRYNDYYPDMGEGDWMVWRDELICIDPYHAKSLNHIFWMDRSKG